MSMLLDTNVLTRLAQLSHPHHADAMAAVTILRHGGESLHIVPQNLYEFWAVATRPVSGNGLGLHVAEARLEIIHIRSIFSLIPDSPAVVEEWESLVEAYEAKGKSSHDARLVAAMNVNNVHKILTFNDRDFARYSAITVLNPSQIAQQASS
jgi:predicted nucleic acid-binding protein